ncbi:MAG: hypothetical protein M3R04_09365, partial [bacterium]|nr:hypothetical protein [bacterium]
PEDHRLKAALHSSSKLVLVRLMLSMSSPPGTRWVLGFVAPAEALRPAGGEQRMYRMCLTKTE